MYNKLLGFVRRMNFFSKVFLVYTTIIVLSLFLMAQIIIGSLSSSALEKETQYNKVVLYNINSMFEQKKKTTVEMAKQAYSSTSLYNKIFGFLENDYDRYSADYYESRKNFIAYIKSLFASDNNIKGITAYKKADNSCLEISLQQETSLSGSSYKYQEMINQIEKYSPGVVIYPAHKPTYPEEGYVYTMAMNLKNIVSLRNIGTLIVDYKTDSVADEIAKYSDKVTGDILIFTNDGSTIYDSTGIYYTEKYPHIDLLQGDTSSVKIEGQDCTLNVVKNKDLNITIAGIIPKDKALKKINSTKELISMVSVFCILTILVFTFITTNIFSARIKKVMKAIKNVRKGNLAVRIPLTESRDELYEISDSFNSMCNDLEKYIEKVYISEIKQKNAELMALQAQINPHFLYNTLEAIRMKANSSGAKEASEMILILSKLFRNAVKEHSITNIRDEIETSRLYLKLFEIRYGDRLSATFEIDEDILDSGIIRHTIQPIIENYIFHGFDSSVDDNCILIKGQRKGNYIFITIKDNGLGIDEAALDKIRTDLRLMDLNNRNSIGLINVHERIRIIMGSDCGLEIDSEKGIGTTVLIKILAKSEEELKRDVQGFTGR